MTLSNIIGSLGSVSIHQGIRIIIKKGVPRHPFLIHRVGLFYNKQSLLIWQ